ARPRRPGADLGLPGLPGRLATPQPFSRHRRPLPRRRRLVQPAGPPHERDQADRPRERKHRLLHHPHSHLLPGGPDGAAHPLRLNLLPRRAQTAQLTSFGYTFVQNAGIEDLKVTGGDNGNIRFQWTANSWAKNIDDTAWLDEGFALDSTFRVEVRDSSVHDAVWPVPGGGGYAISLSGATSEALVENSIIMKANKVMVARSGGTASVFGYNYVDDGFILGNEGWIEMGLNASHMVGPHHVLFEGNYGFNFDSDKTHGNAIYHTVFRNHLSGIRRDFGDSGSGNGPKRAAGAAFYSYWHSFLGNVLGVQGQMAGWVYESGSMDQPAIFLLGWDDWAPYPVDAKVAATTIRHGNFDYVTNSVKWDPSIRRTPLPT